MESPQSSRSSRSRDLGIDTLRGVAVLLMVSNHVIGNRTSGLLVDDDSWWRFFCQALEDVRMPLFVALSGFVYARRPVQASEVTRLVRGKARRLLVPLLIVGGAFFVVQATVPGVNQKPRLEELPHLFLFDPWYLWFLQALFLIFVLVAALDVSWVLRTPTGWAATTAVAGAAFVLLRVPPEMAVFSVNGSLRLLPFFLLGYGAKAHGAWLLRPRVIGAALAMLAPVYGLRLYTLLTVDRPAPVADRALSLAVAALAIGALLAGRDRLALRPLAWLGRFSFAIYLLHVFGAAGVRIVAMRLGVDETGVLFVLGLVAGVTGPVVFELLFGRWAAVSWAVLGQKPRRTPVASADPTESEQRPVGLEHADVAHADVAHVDVGDGVVQEGTDMTGGLVLDTHR